MKNPDGPKRVDSFGNAIRGVSHLVRTEVHAQIHLVCSAVVVACAAAFSISAVEWCLVILAIGLVWAAEAVSTAIEKIVDLGQSGKRFNRRTGQGSGRWSSPAGRSGRGRGRPFRVRAADRAIPADRRGAPGPLSFQPGALQTCPGIWLASRNLGSQGALSTTSRDQTLRLP